MKIKFEKDTMFGDGVQIDLTGDEVAIAIEAYLMTHGVSMYGPRTIRVNGKPIKDAAVYVDPGGSVMWDGVLWKRIGEMDGRAAEKCRSRKDCRFNDKKLNGSCSCKDRDTDGREFTYCTGPCEHFKPKK